MLQKMSMKSWRAFSPHSMMRRHAVDVLDHRVMIASIPRNPYYSLIFALLVNGDFGFSPCDASNACAMRCDRFVYHVITFIFPFFLSDIGYQLPIGNSSNYIQTAESSTAYTYTFIQQYSSTDAERSSNQQSHLLSVCIAL